MTDFRQLGVERLFFCDTEQWRVFCDMEPWRDRIEGQGHAFDASADLERFPALQHHPLVWASMNSLAESGPPATDASTPRN